MTTKPGRAKTAAKTLARPQYWEGFGAYRRELTDGDNPYDFGTPERDAWADGWLDAKQEGPLLDAGKSVIRSKTFWAGFVVIIMSIASWFQAADVAASPAIVAVLGGIIGMLMIVLRFLTNEPVTPVIRFPTQR